MGDKRAERLIREYVSIVLKEDDGYGDIMSAAADNPMGMMFVSPDQLYNIFMQPFVNATKHMAGKTKELSLSAQTALKTAFQAVATSILPWLEDEYADITAQHKQQMDKIKSEYAQYYQATWDAYKNDDVMVAAFMYRPDLFVTAALAKKAPKAVAKVLSVLSGGKLDDVLKRLLGSKDKKKKGKHGKKLGDMSWDDLFGDDGGLKYATGPGWTAESVVKEDSSEGEEQSPLVKLVNNKKVRALLKTSDKAQKMSAQAKGVTQSMLKDIFSQAQSVMNSKDLTDLQNKLGKKVPGTEKLASVPQQERQKLEQVLMSSVKQGIKAYYVKQLQAHAKHAVSAGVPEDHPYVKDFLNVASKINNL